MKMTNSLFWDKKVRIKTESVLAFFPKVWYNKTKDLENKERIGLWKD
jgi:hypothetical protein